MFEIEQKIYNALIEEVATKHRYQQIALQSAGIDLDDFTINIDEGDIQMAKIEVMEAYHIHEPIEPTCPQRPTKGPNSEDNLNKAISVFTSINNGLGGL